MYSGSVGVWGWFGGGALNLAVKEQRGHRLTCVVGAVAATPHSRTRPGLGQLGKFPELRLSRRFDSSEQRQKEGVGGWG